MSRLVLINPEILEPERRRGDRGGLPVGARLLRQGDARRAHPRARAGSRRQAVRVRGRRAARGLRPARDRSPRRQAVRRLPVGAEAPAHAQEAREGAQGARDPAPKRVRVRRSERSHSATANHPAPLRLVFAGTPDFAVPALEALCRARRTGRRRLHAARPPAGPRPQLAASPVKQCALRHGLPVEQPRRCAIRRRSNACGAGRADRHGRRRVRVAAAADRFCDTPRLGCLNIHASLLPRWRGAAPIQRAILRGDARPA